MVLCLTRANGLTGNCPDVGVLRLDTNGGLEHILEDLALVSGCLRLQLAVVGEVCTRASKEARIKAIHKDLANTDRKLLLVDEQTRGSKDLSAIV
jgi:hypothetical protein